MRMATWISPCCAWARTSCCAGLGGCAFERANEAWGFDGGAAWTTAFSATWEDPEALPTMAFGNYLKPETVDDGSYVCDDDQLVRPDASRPAVRAA